MIMRIPRWKYILKTFGRRYNDEQKQNVAAGFAYDFELPYPYPQNEHEEGMNWIACNPVTSARADW